jgi:anti-sigma factor RsiW
MNERPLTEDLLSALLDDEVDAPTRTEVEARLAVSAEWQSVLAEVAETRAALRGLGAVDAPEGFWSRVLQSDDVVVDLTARRAPRSVRTRRFVALGGAAAAAAFVVGVVAFPSAAPDRVRPPVAAFSDAHASRSSVGTDAISTLASVGVSRFGR